MLPSSKPPLTFHLAILQERHQLCNTHQQSNVLQSLHETTQCNQCKNDERLQCCNHQVGEEHSQLAYLECGCIPFNFTNVLHFKIF